MLEVIIIHKTFFLSKDPFNPQSRFVNNTFAVDMACSINLSPTFCSISYSFFSKKFSVTENCTELAINLFAMEISGIVNEDDTFQMLNSVLWTILIIIKRFDGVIIEKFYFSNV